MSHAESTLDACLGKLPGPIQERIRSWRWTAERRIGLDSRPQTFHPVRDSRRGQQFDEVWEQAQGQLGCGGNGCVVVKQTKVSPPTGSHCPPEHRAVKIIPVDDKRWKYYLRELDALITFSDNKYSASFVKFLGWYKFDLEDQLFIITEYCQNGDLRRHLEAQPDCLPESEAKGIVWQVLWALQIMHEDKRIHGDIKLSNVLIAQRPPDRWSVKVCDLGLSKRVEQAAGGNASMSIHFSPGYCPPEKTSIYDNHENIDGYKVDMWCFGEVVLRVLTGKPSFKNVKEMATWCRTGEGYPDQLLRDLQVSEDAIDFLHWVMACRPEDRPTAEAACRHSWWADLDTRPARGRPAPSLTQLRRMSRCSALDMHLPLEEPDARHASWKPHPYLDHEAWSDYAPPYLEWDTTASGWATSPASSPQNETYGTGLYQQTYPVSGPQLPLADDLPRRQQQLEPGPFARQDYDLYQAPHASRLSDDTRPIKARLNFLELLRQQRQQRNNHEKWGQNTSGSYDGLDGPQQQGSSYPKQVRFADGMHDRSRGSPKQDSWHKGHARPTPAQRKAPRPDPQGLGRLATLGDLTIGTTGQPVHILVNPVNMRSQRRPQTGHMADQIANPEASFAQKGRGRSLLDNLSRRVEKTDPLREAEAQLRQQEERVARLQAVTAPCKYEDSAMLRATTARITELFGEIEQLTKADARPREIKKEEFRLAEALFVMTRPRSQAGTPS